MTDTLNREQVAKMLFVHEETVSRYVAEENLPGIRLGKSYVFIKEDVLQWLRDKIRREMEETQQMESDAKEISRYPSFDELPEV